MNGVGRSVGRVGVIVVGVVSLAAGSAATTTAEDVTIIVDQGGSGEYTKVADALDSAEAGDTIHIRPGTYVEAVTIDEEVTVTGDGPREDIVIVAPGDEPVIWIDGARAIISDVTLRGDESVILVTGGAPTLRGIVFDGVGSIFTPDEGCHALFGPAGCNAVSLVLDGTDAEVIGNRFADSGQIRVVGGSNAVIEGNELTGTAHIFLEAFGDDTVIRGNTIIDAEHAAIAIYSSGRPTIEDNVISGSGTSGIEVGLQLAPGIEPVIRGNIISDGQTGIEVASGAVPLIEGNELHGNASAIVIAGSDATVTGNWLHDNSSGIFVMQGAPKLNGNTITGGKVGIGLGSDRAHPLLTDNSVCDNDTNVSLIFGAEMPDTADNDICADT